jgi:hypothetical protein
VRHIVTFLILLVGTRMIEAAYQRGGRIVGVPTFLFVVTVGLASLIDSIDKVRDAATHHPYLLSAGIVLLGLMAFAFGPQSEPWESAANSETARAVVKATGRVGISPAKTATIAGLVVSVLAVAFAAWWNSGRTDPSAGAYKNLEAKVSSNLPGLMQLSPDSFAGLKARGVQQSDAASSDAIRGFRSEAERMREERLSRLRALNISTEQRQAAAAGIEAITRGTREQREAGIRATTSAGTADAVKTITENETAKIRRVAATEIDKAAQEYLSDARRRIAATPADQLDAAVAALASTIDARLKGISAASVGDGVRVALNSRAGEIDEAAKRGAAAAVKTTAEQMKRELDDLFGRLDAAIRAATEQAERDAAAAKSQREAEASAARQKLAKDAAEAESKRERERMQAAAAAAAMAILAEQSEADEAPRRRMEQLRAQIRAHGFNFCENKFVNGTLIPVQNRNVANVERCAALCASLPSCDGFSAHTYGREFNCQTFSRSQLACCALSTVFSAMKRPC